MTTEEKFGIITDALGSVAKRYCSPYDILPLASWLLLTDDLRPLLRSVNVWDPGDGYQALKDGAPRLVIFCNRAGAESLCIRIAMRRHVKIISGSTEPFRSFNDIVHSNVSPKFNNLHVTWIDTSMLVYLAISTIDLPPDYNRSFMFTEVLAGAANILFRDRLPQPKYIT